MLAFVSKNQAAATPRTSDGRLLELVKLALDEPQHQAGLAHSHVAQQHQLELADLGLGQSSIGLTRAPSGSHARRGQGPGVSSLAQVEHRGRWSLESRRRIPLKISGLRSRSVSSKYKRNLNK